MPLRAHTLLAQWEPRPARQGQLRQKAAKMHLVLSGSSSKSELTGEGDCSFVTAFGNRTVLYDHIGDNVWWWWE